MHDLKTSLAVLAFLVALLVGVYVLSFVTSTPFAVQRADEAIGDSFTPGPPPPEVLEMLEKSRGFEVLVSYTNRGFEPLAAVINVGESIRFTNNSQNDLWIAASGTASAPTYPGVSKCGTSELDSCKVLKPREFWEFTFTKSGKWEFLNNLDKGKTGSVMVEVSDKK